MVEIFIGPPQMPAARGSALAFWHLPGVGPIKIPITLKKHVTVILLFNIGFIYYIYYIIISLCHFYIIDYSLVKCVEWVGYHGGMGAREVQ